MEVVAIITNLETDDAVEFIELYSTALKNAAQDEGDMSALKSDLNVIEEVENREEIQNICKKIKETL